MKERDEKLEKLWERLEDIPLNPETECIDEPFLEWEVGTHREEIWHWFDSMHSKGVAYLLYGRTSAKISLPDVDYVKQFDNQGNCITFCTLRQQVKHIIGLDHKDPYHRYGKAYYKPYRNYWDGFNGKFSPLVDAGYMECCCNENNHYTYSFTEKGLEWLGEQLGIIIKTEKNKHKTL